MLSAHHSAVPPELATIGVSSRQQAIELFRNRVGDGRDETLFRNSISGDIQDIAETLREHRPLKPSRVDAIGPMLHASDQDLWKLIRNYLDPGLLSPDDASEEPRTSGKASKPQLASKAVVLGTQSEIPLASDIAEPEADKPTGQGYLRDKVLRRAVELRAMEAATAYFSGERYSIEDTSSSRPYDLKCSKLGVEIRVEVKGSRGDGTEVLLTAGEVEHARTSGVRTDLFVWGDIEIDDGAEVPRAHGGRRVALIPNWRPAEADLSATQYRYRVPLADRKC